MKIGSSTYGIESLKRKDIIAAHDFLPEKSRAG
jgi:hypothetical protein